MTPRRSYLVILGCPTNGFTQGGTSQRPRAKSPGPNTRPSAGRTRRRASVSRYTSSRPASSPTRTPRTGCSHQATTRVRTISETAEAFSMELSGTASVAPKALTGTSTPSRSSVIAASGQLAARNSLASGHADARDDRKAFAMGQESQWAHMRWE